MEERNTLCDRALWGKRERQEERDGSGEILVPIGRHYLENWARFAQRQKAWGGVKICLANVKSRVTAAEAF